MNGESLPITGPEALSFAEVTEKLGAVIGKRLRLQPISDEEARQRYAATGTSLVQIEAHVSLWRAIREGRLAQTSDTFERVLGRKPIARISGRRRTWRRFVEQKNERLAGCK